MRLLRKARKFGDRLIVGLNSDESVMRVRGTYTPPVLDELHRKYTLMHIRYVDEVVIFRDDTAAQLILDVEPAICVKGSSNLPQDELNAMDWINAQFKCIKPLEHHRDLHSSDIVRKCFHYYQGEGSGA